MVTKVTTDRIRLFRLLKKTPDPRSRAFPRDQCSTGSVALGPVEEAAGPRLPHHTRAAASLLTLTSARHPRDLLNSVVWRQTDQCGGVLQWSTNPTGGRPPFSELGGWRSGNSLLFLTCFHAIFGLVFKEGQIDLYMVKRKPLYELCGSPQQG